MSPRGPDEGDSPPGRALDPGGGTARRPDDAEASPPEDDSMREDLPPGPSLDSSGRIVRPSPAGSGSAPVDDRPRDRPGDSRDGSDRLTLEPLAGSIDDSAHARRGEPADDSGEPLELEHRPRPSASAEPVPVHFGASVRPRKFGRLMGCLAVLLALAGVMLLATWLVGRTVTAPGPLIIQSEPSGAQVIIDGVRVGQTPFATDNLYRIDTVPIELRHPGYLTWHGTFRGRVKQKLKVRMLRAPSPRPVPAQRR